MEQLGALVWKNFLQRRRNLKALAWELLFTALVAYTFQSAKESISKLRWLSYSLL